MWVVRDVRLAAAVGGGLLGELAVDLVPQLSVVVTSHQDRVDTVRVPLTVRQRIVVHVAHDRCKPHVTIGMKHHY